MQPAQVAASCFQKILEAAIYKAEAAKPLKFNLTNYQNETGNIWWELLVKKGWSPTNEPYFLGFLDGLSGIRAG